MSDAGMVVRFVRDLPTKYRRGLFDSMAACVSKSLGYMGQGPSVLANYPP
jgi:hypothetical protein